MVCCFFFVCLEQYDAFVKFSHDQVERRLAESAFSCKYIVHVHALPLMLSLL